MAEARRAGRKSMPAISLAEHVRGGTVVWLVSDGMPRRRTMGANKVINSLLQSVAGTLI
jgi:hypothetical protein